MKWKFPRSFESMCVCIGILFIAIMVCIVPADAGLRVYNAKYMGEVSPGDEIIHTMTVLTEANDAPMDIRVDLAGFGQSEDRSYNQLSPLEDTSPYSARPFITLDTSSFRLIPGESKEIKAKIAIPKDAGAGGRYAIINIYNVPAGGGQMSVVTAMMVPVMITIKGTPLTETGSITDVSVGSATESKPIVVVTTFKHTGNHHFYGAVNEVKVTDAAGNELAKIPLPPSATAIIPGNTVKFFAMIDKSLATGSYMVTSTVAKSDGTKLDEKSTTFEVKTAYAPPAGISAVQGYANIVLKPTQTTAPGPDALVICGLLALGVFIAGSRKRK